MKTVSRLYKQFKPTSYNVSWHLDTVEDDGLIYGNVTIMGEQHNDKTIRLHAKGLTISQVIVNKDMIADFSVEDDELVIPHASAGDVEVVITYSLKMSDSMHGIYPCYYNDGGAKKKLYATQFESHHAREALPCIDEPEAKAIFHVSMYTKSSVVAISNMPAVYSNDEATPGILCTRFDPTPRMSTYLLAFVVGDLQKKSAKTKSGVEVNVWATGAQPSQLLDFPLDVAVRSIDFFDEYFGVPYPLPKSDHVALPDFSVGAMENWGLITYREVALLADKDSAQSSREWIATVIAHETSHQWFGNLVTMKWWDDLWLNESFATVMEYIAVDSMFPSWNAWNNFASQETLSALRRDHLAGVQAVKTPVNHPDEISTLFDPSIVYAKGARLLKMLRGYMGEEAFRSGLTAYFKAHAYGNTTGADLWKAFSDASGKDIGHFMELWLTQSGLPLVSITSTNTGYKLDQKRFVVGDDADDRIWPIPLSAAHNAFPVLLDTTSAEVTAPHSFPLLNLGNTAHFISKYDDASMRLILGELKKRTLSTVDRLAFLHETSLLTRTGDAKSGDMVSIVKQYSSETEEPVWNIITMVIGDLKRFVEEDDEAESQLKSLIKSLARPLFDTLGTQAQPNETEQETKLRATILGILSYGDDKEVIDYALKTFSDTKDLATLPGETRGVILATAVKHGTVREFDRLLKLHSTTSNPEFREDIVAGLTATKDTELIKRLLDRLTDASQVKPQDLTRWYVSLLRSRYARTAAWQWMTDNWSWIEKTFDGDKSYDDYARYSASILGSRDWLHKYTEFFSPLATQTALKRAVEIGITEMTARVEWLERDSEGVIAALAQETA